MKVFNTRSIIFKTAIIYVFLTILNVSIFVLMVFENQLDLIAENAILNSQHTGSSLKYRIDNILNMEKDLTSVHVNKIIKEAGSLGINNITLYNENGKVFVNIINSKIVDKEVADLSDLKMINMAITKQSFEDKLFYHSVNRKERSITLYIPFGYSKSEIGVASIVLKMKDIDRQMSYLYRQCFLIGLLVTIIHVLFAVFISKIILLPLRKLNEATQMISQGNLNVRVPITGYDEIGQLASSFNEMGVALQRMRDEAKGANPLTGLPGNLVIAKYIDKCLVSQKPICVLYCDLDNFKAYNDKYGFTKGDEALLYTRDCLVEAGKHKGGNDIFIGHEGGDDFVVVIGYQFWQEYTKALIMNFDRNIYQFYNSTDARNGYIESVNRKGEAQRFPLMSISVAAVTNMQRAFRRHAEIVAVAAEVKKYVKSMDGSCYAIDRRSGPVSPTQLIDPDMVNRARRSMRQ
ncbi:MAG: HAMP domain-containing protein [Fibrobacter sp.]|nr:HAMP domain-containing protein [Fibrobacter sp.]